MTWAVSLLCCDGPCCGPGLATALAPLGDVVRLERATCLSECEKAPVVRVRYDDGGRRVTALLSGAERPDLAAALRSWVEADRGPLPQDLRSAEFAPGEGGGCLCDEELPPPSD